MPLLYLGIVPTALGYGLFQIGIRSLSATMASILTMCELLTAAILARILLGERLGMLGLLGAGCMLGAMAIILFTPSRMPPRIRNVGAHGGAFRDRVSWGLVNEGGAASEGAGRAFDAAGNVTLQSKRHPHTCLAAVHPGTWMSAQAGRDVHDATTGRLPEER